MAAYDFTTRRLFVDAHLASGSHVSLDRDQANYLVNVLRLGADARLLIFNGRDGEWRAHLEVAGKRDAALCVESMERPQPSSGDLWLLFAPLKHARLDYMVQKAVEMGASRLTPVITRRTQVHRLNAERMRANAIEAAEQCGVLAIPEIDLPVALEKRLADWSADRTLIFCDEAAPIADPVATLQTREDGKRPALAVLIGPEGGFDEGERAMLGGFPRALPISLGPRILRADTAAVAALAIVQAALGDWRGE